MSATRFADRAFLSDRHSGALVDTAGSVEWLTCPDSTAPRSSAGLLGPKRDTGRSDPLAARRAAAGT